MLTHEKAQSWEIIVEGIELLILKMDFRQFKFFSQLPTEIRFNIWHYACCIPRAIELWVRQKAAFFSFQFGMSLSTTRLILDVIF
jgi:hypothetical protein